VYEVVSSVCLLVRLIQLAVHHHAQTLNPPPLIHEHHDDVTPPMMNFRSRDDTGKHACAVG